MRTFRTLILAAPVLTACGDSAGPDGDFPAIAGVYDYSATVGGIPGASITGTITVADDSRETTEFSGTFVITLAGGGVPPQSFTGELMSARVTREGSVRFDFEDPAYPHTGTLNGSTITGTWTITGDDSSFSGSFTAIRRPPL